MTSQECWLNFKSKSLDGFYPALEAGEIKAGMVLIFRYQGPKGAPGMPEVCQPVQSHL